jgi:tetratricopeptide (TPR) repeat protein
MPRSAAAKTDPAVSGEQPLLEKIRGSEAAGRMDEASRARFELSGLYLQKALWEWTEFGGNGPDLDLIRKILAVLDEVIRLRPGTELAAEAQLRRAKVYHNGLSGLWDQSHRKEAREELNKVLELYPRMAAAREAREILANLGK